MGTAVGAKKRRLCRHTFKVAGRGRKGDERVKVKTPHKAAHKSKHHDWSRSKSLAFLDAASPTSREYEIRNEECGCQAVGRRLSFFGFVSGAFVSHLRAVHVSLNLTNHSVASFSFLARNHQQNHILGLVLWSYLVDAVMSIRVEPAFW